MKKAYKIDENGFYIEDFLYDDKGQVSENNIITIDIPQGIYVPKWNGNEWVEGSTQDYLNLIRSLETEEPTEMEKIRADVDYILLMQGL